MKPWLRENTQDWINKLESRLEDIDHYLRRTVEWCEDNQIYDDEKVMSCAFITCIWVSHMRDEPISFSELVSFLGIEGSGTEDDKMYDLGPAFKDMDLEEILNLLAGNLSNW
jgi:hypothetical protein